MYDISYMYNIHFIYDQLILLSLSILTAIFQVDMG